MIGAGLRLNVWAPRPSPDAFDYAAEQAEALAAHAVVTRVSEDRAESPPDADLDLYHAGNSASYGFVYRAALKRPGVALLHDWSLHQLVLSETVGRGNTTDYLREMRHAHGEEGLFVARQIARSLGGDLWPALYPLNDRLLEASLGVVAPTPGAAARARLRLGDRPVMSLFPHLTLPHPLPTRAEARKTLGLPEAAFVITAPGPATRFSQLDLVVKVLARLGDRHPQMQLVVAGPADRDLPLERWARSSTPGINLQVTGPLRSGDLTLHLIAADLVLALRFPSDGGLAEAVVPALGLGRPVLVTAGSAADEAFPEGVVVPIDPGPGGEAGLDALLSRLVEDFHLRESIGRSARAHALAHHDLGTTTRALAVFLEEVRGDVDRLKQSVALGRPHEGSLGARLLHEVRRTRHELGLGELSLGVEPLLAPLGG